ncbi:hypothetical protein ACFE04_008833 [Oxalis oulophora]
MALKVLSALDSAKTRFYHFKTIIVAGMGLFTDSYDLFCITPILKLLSRIYYKDSKLPNLVTAAMLTTALLGTVFGQLIFGHLGDRMGRRHVYGLALILMVLSSLASGFSICTEKTCVLLSLGFFRFLLGFGVGGDYPLSATIMSELSNKKTRGAFIAAMFSMQGFGILAGAAVTMVVCKVFDEASGNATPEHTPKGANVAWRLILMIGAIPAALTFYWRMMMPETARYTALVEQNLDQAIKDIKKVLEVPIGEIREDSSPPPLNPPPYPLFSRQFFRRHGRDLLSCSLSWFLVDIVFYSSNFFQSKIYYKYIYNNEKKVNAYEEALRISELQAIVAVCSTIPAYFFTVYFIDKIGRKKIQKLGFFCMAMVYFSIGIPYYFYWSKHTNIGFMILYCLTFFFANFGPNTTTFIVPAELFPARFRSTCHGISGAIGKLGAIIGSVVVLWVAPDHTKLEDDTENERIRMTATLVFLGGVCIVGIMEETFVPPQYRQQMYNLKQGRRLVKEYIMYFDQFLLKFNVEESEEVVLSRFVM